MLVNQEIIGLDKKSLEIIEKKYEKAMRAMGIDVKSLPIYTNEEDFAKNFKRTSIQKTVQVSFTSSL